MEFKSGDRLMRIGDTIRFSCNGSGRGGHFTVYATIRKINTKTIVAVENKGSYRPGTNWRVDKTLVCLVETN